MATSRGVFQFNLPSGKLTYLAGKLTKIANILFPTEDGDFPASHVSFKGYIMVHPS